MVKNMRELKLTTFPEREAETSEDYKIITSFWIRFCFGYIQKRKNISNVLEGFMGT